MVKGLKSGLLVLSMLAAATPAFAQQGWGGHGGQHEGGGGERRWSGNSGGGGNAPGGGERWSGGNRGGAMPASGGQPPQAPAPSSPSAPNRGWSDNGGNRGWQSQPPRAFNPGQPMPGGPDRPWAGRGYDHANRPFTPRPDMPRGDPGRPPQGFARPAPDRPDFGRPAYARPAPDWNRGWQGGGQRLNGTDRWRDQRRWSNDWQRDGRYDWQSYRYANRNQFRLPSYRPPLGRGYGYNRFSIGVYLDAPLFGDGYWIDDPYSYRLPPAYGTLRWVRYYDDALLVDVRDGYVVDVIHDFFW